MRRLSDTATLDLAAYEVGNALWKRVSLKKDVSQSEAKDLLATLTRVFLMDGFNAIGWRDLNHPAVLDLAVEHNISFYDACYITAGATLRVPLVTEDEKLKRIAAKSCPGKNSEPYYAL